MPLSLNSLCQQISRWRKDSSWHRTAEKPGEYDAVIQLKVVVQPGGSNQLPNAYLLYQGNVAWKVNFVLGKMEVARGPDKSSFSRMVDGKFNLI